MNRLRLPALLAAGLFTTPAAALAQAVRVGHVERIAELRENARAVTLHGVTDRFQVLRAGGDWQDAGPDAVLFEQDRVRVARYLDVRLEVERPTQRGRLVFTHEVRDDDGGLVFALPTGSGPANYTIGEDTAAATELGIVIANGALVVDWRTGRLAVTVAGHRAVVVGTRVAFASDATGNTAFIYVLEGTVLLPASGLTIEPGQVIQLQRGAAPTPTSPSNQILAAYRDATDYNARRVWAQFRPFWRKPAFFLPALGAIGGGIAFLATRNGDDSGPRNVDIIIRIPF